MRFALVTLGSTGDLYPFLAVGRALVEQGHEVVLLSQEPYRAEASRAGLQFVPVADARQHQRTLAHPKLWHPVEGFGVLWRHLCLPAALPTWEALQALSSSGGVGAAQPLRVLASPLAIGARLARDTGPIRLWSAYLSPAAFRRLDNPMFVGPWQVPRWWPEAGRRWAWQLLDRWKLEPLARATVERLIAQVGAQPIAGSVFGDWIHSPDGGLAFYDEGFCSLPSRTAGRATRSPPQHPIHQIGFPNFEWEAPAAPGPTLPFDAAPWIVFGGSAGTLGKSDAYALASHLTDRSDRPAVLLDARLTGPKRLSSTLLGLPMQPLPALLQHAHGFVHHAGIGSCAQGLAAGIPQFLIPRAYDQFENAAALERSGSGWVAPHALRNAPAAQLARWIAQLDPEPARRAMVPNHSHPSAPNVAVREAVSRLTAAD